MNTTTTWPHGNCVIARHSISDQGYSGPFFVCGSGPLARVPHLFPLRSQALVLFLLRDMNPQPNRNLCRAKKKSREDIIFPHKVGSHLCELLKFCGEERRHPPLCRNPDQATETADGPMKQKQLCVKDVNGLLVRLTTSKRLTNILPKTKPY